MVNVGKYTVRPMDTMATKMVAFPKPTKMFFFSLLKI